jgi:hypothetical protein
MRLGHNHNVMYQGEVYHVQTEDSGIKNPHIITLLYQGGTILASKKTTYADIVTFENLDMLVDELMKDQHKGMLRALKSGDYDQKITQMKGAPAATITPAAPAAVVVPAPAPAPAVAAFLVPEVPADMAAEVAALAEVLAEPVAEVPVEGDEVTDMDDLIALLEVQVEKKPAASLDDAILDFFAIK